MLEGEILEEVEAFSYLGSIVDRQGGTEWLSGLEHWTGDRVVLGPNPASPTLLRNFGNSVYPTLPVSFGGDTKSFYPFYLVSMPGKVTHPTSRHWKHLCNLSWTPPPTLRVHKSSWTTLEISPATFVCYPVSMMCSKSNQIRG